MQLSDFDYQLPPELIATHPAAQRDGSRLMVVRRDSSDREHRRFHDLPDLLRDGDCLVLNDSRVIPARVRARRASGGLVEFLLVRPSPAAEEGNAWEALARPARKLTAGEWLELPDDDGEIEILAGGGERMRRILFHLKKGASEGADPIAYLNQRGEMPLPPYILQQRKARGEAAYVAGEDVERYQTVYAQPAGSIAAPTAGLHFTPEILEHIRRKGIEVRRVTLHVGLGTFEPIEEEDPAKHRMHFERYALDEENAAGIERARIDPARRIVAVGTTAVRTLESSMRKENAVKPGQGETDLFIAPGFQFKAVDAMITNFHLPKSSLMMLVCAFGGREKMLAAYQDAVEEKYRFFSYGDAMLIE